ncbi:MAG: GHKL domain-containing protein [Lachnospiraceae bacterium]|nr:GHKL domain-containing protein [Lachnospiraceae bacterium]
MNDFLQTLILTCIEMMCCKIFFEVFLEKRYPEKQYMNFYIFATLTVLISVIAVTLQNSNVFRILMILLIIGLLMGILYEGSPLQILFCTVGFYGILVAVDIIMMKIVLYMIPDKENIILQDPVRTTILALMCKTVLLICVISLNKRLKKEGNFYLLSEVEWIKFLYFPLLTIISMQIFIMNESHQVNYVIWISIGLIIGNFIIFYMVKDIVSKEKRLQELLIGQERTLNQTTMYQQMNENYKEQRLKVHEFKNQINCIQGLLDTGEYEKVSDYVNHIHDTWKGEMNYILTNHAIVNSILNQKYAQARKNGITFIIKVSDLGTLQMRDEDIVTLLANLLDNAIEAVKEIWESDRTVKCIIQYQDSTLTICVRNPVAKAVIPVKGRFITTKREKKNHGIGLINIDKIVQKYGGENVCGCKDGYFTTTIIIQNV